MCVNIFLNWFIAFQQYRSDCAGSVVSIKTKTCQLGFEPVRSAYPRSVCASVVPAHRYSFISCQTCLDGLPPSTLTVFWSLKKKSSRLQYKMRLVYKRNITAGLLPMGLKLFVLRVCVCVWKRFCWSVPSLQQRGLCVPTCKIIPQLQCVKRGWWLLVTLLFASFPSWAARKTYF